MVASMSIKLKAACAALGLLLLAACAPAVAQQVVSDPTRPPAGVMTGEGDGGYTGPLLQSIISTSAGRAAIINGERVSVGAKYGDARVVKITETEVVLRSDSGTETLRLYPSVDIRKAAAGGGKRSSQSRGKQHE